MGGSIGNQERIQNMIHRHGQDEIIEFAFEENLIIDNNQWTRIFILMNKYYPSYSYLKGTLTNGNKDLAWEDIIINEMKLSDGEYIDVNFNIPVFIQNGTSIDRVFTTDGGLRAVYEYRKEEPKRFFISMYPNVYINENSSFIDIGNSVLLDQSLAAFENRKILKDFLKSLELILESKIVDVESHKFKNMFTNKYGFTDKVKLVS